MIHLQYLNLSNSKIDRLPKTAADCLYAFSNTGRCVYNEVKMAI